METFTRRSALLTGTAALAATARPRALGAQGLTTVRIGAALDDSTTPILFADHAGYFRRYGIAAEIVKITSGAAVAAAVAGGSLDFGKSSIYAIIAAHVRGFPFQLVAPTGSYSSADPDAGLLVAATSPIRVAADLNGKTLGVSSLQDLNMVATEAWVDKNGGNSSTMRFLELSPPSVLDALVAARIAAAPVQDPLMSTIMATGAARNIGSFNDAIARTYQSAGIFATSGWIARNRDVVERFVRAMRDANIYLGKHEGEGVPLIAAFLGISEGSAQQLHHPGRPPFLLPSEIQPLIDLTAKYKIIPHGFAAEELISPAALKLPR
jgi:NitT/TauT family transport system substrate-binding protein